MKYCPNLSDKKVKKEFDELVAATNKNLAYLIWDLNKGNFIDKNSDGSENTEFKNLQNKVGRFQAVKETAKSILSGKTPIEQSIKPGVAELFESDQKLANTVYEALEFSKENINISTFTNYSGAAQGGDTIWENIGKEFGLGKQVNYRPEDLNKLTKEQLQEVENAYQQAVKDLGRKPLSSNTFAGGLVRRDYLQAKAADAVFAISTIVEPGQKDPKGYVNKTNKPLVAGGTGYAVQMAINLGKPVYVFDQNKNEWFVWNNNTFKKTDTPILTRKFAGIGTREINENGKQAIKNVYKKATQYQITPQQKQQAQQLYSQYLDTIFPDSKVKDIVYRGGGEELIPAIDSIFGSGYYFTPAYKLAQMFADIAEARDRGYRLDTVILNLKTPKYFTEGDSYDFKNTKKEGFDSVYVKTTEKYKGNSFEGINEYVVFEPEQIHILGSKQDIKGFKDFVQNTQQKELTSDKLFGIKEEAEQTPNLDTPQKLDNAIKVSHSLITARTINKYGLDGARFLITNYPSYEQYKELLGDFQNRFTETEKIKIYTGNRKYIQSFIPEFLTLEEDEVLSKNANDMLDSNKIDPESMADYTVKLAISALPKRNQEGAGVLDADGMPAITDYKETIDYLYKKLANNFTLKSQIEIINKAVLKNPSLIPIVKWFKLNDPINTREELLNKIAFFNTFANADTNFITAIIDKDSFKYVIPKTSIEDTYLDRWKANMINSDVVYFDEKTGEYMLDVNKLKKSIEKIEGSKYTLSGLDFLKITGYPDIMNNIIPEARTLASFIVNSKENININDIFNKDKLKVNKELKALVQKTIEENDIQETTSVLDVNNNRRHSIGLPTAYDLMLNYYKNQKNLPFLTLDNNNLVKEIKAGNVKITNLFNYKNSRNIGKEFDKLDKGSMAVAYYNFLMKDIYPVLPSGDRGTEYALEIKWQSENTPSIKNLRNVYLDNLDYRDLASEVGNYGSLFAPVIEILGNSRKASDIDMVLQDFIKEEAKKNEQFFKSVAPDYYRKHRKNLDFEEFSLRYYYSLAQQSALFTGDVENYEDPFKRFTTFTSTRNAVANDPEINNAINDQYERLDKKKADGFIKTIVINDVKMSFPEMNKAFSLNAKEYEEDNKIYDAAGIITLDEAREILIKSGKWNKELDKWYDYESGKSEKLPSVGAPIYKLISTGPLYNEDNTPYKDVNIPHIYKSAYFVLTPRNASGRLKDIYQKMSDNQIGLAVFKSGSKGKNIKTNDIDSDYKNIQNINYDFLGFNLDTSGLEKKYVSDGTQGRKLLIADLFGTDSIKELNTRKETKNTEELVNLLESKIHELDQLKRNKFLEELGVIKDGDSYKLKDSNDSLQKLTKRIEEALLARKVTSVLENQIKEVLKDEVKLVDALTERNKFENMIMSIFNSEVVKRKMPGEMFVQVPDLNNTLKFYTKSENGYTNLAQVKVTLPQKLIPFVNKLEGKNFEEKLSEFNKMIKEGKIDKRILTLVPFRIPTQLQNAIEAVEIVEFLSPTQANTMIVPNGITVKVGSDFDVDKLTSYIPHFAIKGKELIYIDKVQNFEEVEKLLETLEKNKTFLKEGINLLLQKDYRDKNDISAEELSELYEQYSDELENLEPNLREKVKEYNYLKSFNKKNVLENEIIDLSVDILTSEELQKNLLSPDNTDDLKNASLKIIDKLKLQKKFSENKGTNPFTNFERLSFKNVIETRHALISFKSLVGQAALAATNHALAQKAKLSYKNEDFKLYFQGFDKLDTIFSLHNSKAGSTKISFLLKQFISASVDVAKEGNDFIAYVNINQRTFGLVQTLIRMGVDVNTVFAFINQPILRDYQEALDKNDSIANLNKQSNNEIRSSIIRTYGKFSTFNQIKSGKIEPKIFSYASLDGMLKKYEDLTEEEKENQLQVLNHYLIYEQAANDLNKLQQAVTADTKQAGKSLNEVFIREKKYNEIMNSGRFINADKLISNTVLKEQQKAVEEVSKLWPKIFHFSTHSTNNGKELKELFYEKFFKTNTNDLIRGLERLDRFLITYLILNKAGISNYRKRLLIEGEVVKDLIKKKKENKGNTLLKELVPLLPIENRETYNVMLFNKNYKLYDQEKLIAGFEELMQSDKEFAKKLIMQQLLQSGVSLSRNSYQNILPKDYLNLSKKVLSNLENANSFIPDEVLDLFIKTHWKTANELFSTQYIENNKGEKEIYTYQSKLYLKVKNKDNNQYFYLNTGEKNENGNYKFIKVETLGNYPWDINLSGDNSKVSNIIKIEKPKTKYKNIANEEYEISDTADLQTSSNSLRNTWNKFSVEQIKFLKAKNINNFAEFSSAVGEYEAVGISEQEAINTLLNC